MCVDGIVIIYKNIKYIFIKIYNIVFDIILFIKVMGMFFIRFFFWVWNYENILLEKWENVNLVIVIIFKGVSS